VRRQYHFWVGEHGLDAWDVEGLIRLSSGFPVEHVSLDAIAEIDSVYWFNDDREPATVRRVVDYVRLIQEVDLAWPIILGPDGRVMEACIE